MSASEVCALACLLWIRSKSRHHRLGLCFAQPSEAAELSAESALPNGMRLRSLREARDKIDPADGSFLEKLKGAK